jgi:hypothetical protein
MIKSDPTALKEARLQRGSFGEKLSIYGFRHFYAVNALRNGVGVFEVARNMGTSVEIYSEIIREAGHLGCVCNEAGGLSWHPFAYIAVLGISGPSFDTQCSPPRYSARRHCAFLRQPIWKSSGPGLVIAIGPNCSLCAHFDKKLEVTG